MWQVVCFADIDINTLCVDPADIEHRITPKTKAIVAVHYAGHPCDMDKICAIAKKHGVKVIEDVSHAHGACWKGQKCGTFGDVAAMSVMSGKSLAVGEGGMLATNDQEILERAVRHGRLLTIFLAGLRRSERSRTVRFRCSSRTTSRLTASRSRSSRTPRACRTPA